MIFLLEYQQHNKLQTKNYNTLNQSSSVPNEVLTEFHSSGCSVDILKNNILKSKPEFIFLLNAYTMISTLHNLPTPIRGIFRIQPGI